LQTKARSQASSISSPGIVCARLDLVGTRGASEDCIAMRKAPESLDDVVVMVRIFQLLRLTQSGEDEQRTPLILHIFAVHERHVEEYAAVPVELLVKPLVDRPASDRPRQGIGRILLGSAAKHVARELVEQDYAGQRGSCMGQERLRRKLALLLPQLP